MGHEQPGTTIREVLRQRQRHTRESVSLHTVRVTRIREVTPRMRRVTLGGTSLETFPVSGLPADAIRVFLPEATERISRAYTVRRFDPASQEMDIDVLCHEHGPGGLWARALAPGDRVELLGPRHEFWAAPSTQFHLLVGDESALPAIGAILEALPSPVVAIVRVEVDDENDHVDLPSAARTDVQWIHRTRQRRSLVDAVRAVQIPYHTGQAWIAGEAGNARAVRRHLIDGVLPRTAVRAVGYWRAHATMTQLDQEQLASGRDDTELE
jgi:NADPH-dependent ferric siderophore reductase